MFRKMPFAAVTIISLGMVGCASVPMATPEADAAAKRFVVAPQKANVYIYRNESLGSAIKMPVLLDNFAVGDTGPHTYILREVEPGSHVVTSKTENDATLTVDAKPGQNYFIWQEVKLGVFAAGSDLHLVSEQEGKVAVQDCNLIK